MQKACEIIGKMCKIDWFFDRYCSTIDTYKRSNQGYMMAEKPAGHILIECPNTIFHLYARDEGELSKIETFLRNIRGIKRLGLNDIYIWCNRQGILYVTKFHYRKDFSCGLI